MVGLYVNLVIKKQKIILENQDIKSSSPKIFEEITGIKVNEPKSLSGKTVKVSLDGVEYEAIIK